MAGTVIGTRNPVENKTAVVPILMDTNSRRQHIDGRGKDPDK